jgi:Ca-activated chloride channel family protein
MADYKFANPEFLWLFVIIPLMILWYIFRLKKQNASFIVPSNLGFVNSIPSFRQRLRHLLLVFRILSFSLIIIALARPQTSSSRQSVSTEGIDIVLALDVSTSMLAEDFKPNRIEAAKKYAMDFIDKRINDRIGLVIFSGESFTQCPITIDHAVLKNLFEPIKSGMIEDGTAIGMGLATAVSRLNESKAKSRVIVLLTDGVNNTGVIAPITAAEIAKTYGIRVYTIGIGTHGTAPYPIKTSFGIQYRNMDVDIDENILKDIAKETNGKYFRATGNKALEEIYNEIDSLEKTKIDVAIFNRFTEKYLLFALAGFILLILEMLFRYLYFKTVP